MSNGIALNQEQGVSERLNDVEEIIAEMQPTMTKINNRVEKIYDVIVGNETFDQEGIITRLKKLEKENDINKALKNKLVGAFIVGGALWTVILEAIKNMIKH